MKVFKPFHIQCNNEITFFSSPSQRDLIARYQITLHMKSGIVWMSLTHTFTLTILILLRCTNMKWQYIYIYIFFLNVSLCLRSWCLKVSLPICTGHYFLQLVLTMHHPTSTWTWCGSVSKSSCQMPTERSHVSCRPSPPCPSMIKVRAGILILITIPLCLSPRCSEWEKR